MKIKKSHLLVGIVTLLAFFWSYSFSTRIGLFFVVPIWLKIIVIVTLMINFGLLGFTLIQWVDKNIQKRAIRYWALIFSTVLTGLIFLLLPYQRVPFRTTHHLEITSLESDVQLRAILSPDDNLVGRDEIEYSSDVEEYFQTGFRIPKGSQIKYQRPFTGKLTLLFTKESGPTKIYWDGTVKTFDPSFHRDPGHDFEDGWQINDTAYTDLIEVRLPGNTWGQPDLLWAFLGTLLPISDFVTLSSITIFLFFIFFLIVKVNHEVIYNRELFKSWIDFLLSIILIMIMIRVGFPEFLPFWFLLLFLPANIYLSYCQLEWQQRNHHLNWKIFSKISNLIQIVNRKIKFYNQNNWVLWMSLVIIGIVGSIIQLSITSPGLIISGDSVHYMEGARNLAEGNGYVINFIADGPIAITGFDPGYSMSLVPGILLGLDAQTAARLLNAFLLFLTVLVVGYIIHKTTGNVLPAIIASLFIILSTVTVSIYSFAMSEPLFIVLLFATLICWFNQVKKPSIKNAFLLGIVCSFFLIVRLAGIVFLPVLGLGLLIFENSKFKQRIIHAILYGLVSIISPVIFLLRNRSITNTSGRTQGQGLVPFPQESWDVIGKEFSSWFNWQAYFNYDHQRFNAVLISFGVILLLFIMWLIFRKHLKLIKQSDRVVIILFFSSLLYFTSIIINSMTAVPAPTTGGIVRYMIPLFYLLLIIIVNLFSFYWKQPYLFQKLMILFIALVGLQLYHTELIDLLTKTPIVYRHFTDRKNDCGNDVVDVINQQPNLNYYSNRCEYFYFITGRQCKHLSYDLDAYTQEGEINQAIKSGDIIAFTQGFGSNPPGIFSFLSTLEQFDQACYVSFYRWKD